VRLRSTIVADNTAGSADDDCYVDGGAGSGKIVSRGFNLAEACPELANVQPTDILATDPMLGPLQDNGGPTMTHALLPGSPAIAAVTSGPICGTPDQRGVARGLPCDVGAYQTP